MSDETIEIEDSDVIVTVTRTGNPNLERIEEKANEAILRRRRSQPARVSSVPVNLTVFGTELRLEIGAQMVYEVREDLDAISNGCSVCYAIADHQDWREHKSGKTCLSYPLEDSTTEGWLKFKKSMNLPEGIMCFNCLLPTVRRKLSTFDSPL